MTKLKSFGEIPRAGVRQIFPVGIHGEVGYAVAPFSHLLQSLCRPRKPSLIPSFHLPYLLRLLLSSQPWVPFAFQFSESRQAGPPLLAPDNFSVSLEVGCYLRTAPGLSPGDFPPLLSLLQTAAGRVLTASLRTGSLCLMKQRLCPYYFIFQQARNTHPQMHTSPMKYECHTHCGPSKHFLSVSRIIITMPKINAHSVGE